MQKYEQTTFETCLAVSLLNLLDEKITEDKEREMIEYALDYVKNNFKIGHLNFIAKEYDKEIDFYVKHM